MSYGNLYLRNGVTRKDAEFALTAAGTICADCRPDIVVYGAYVEAGVPVIQMHVQHDDDCPWLAAQQLDEHGGVQEVRIVQP